MKNTLFPGRSNYVGPKVGWFGLLHHTVLCEKSHDVTERVRYIKRRKPKNEISVRLHNMIYLGKCEATAKREALGIDYKTKFAALSNDFMTKCGALYDDYTAKRVPFDTNYVAKRTTFYADYVVNYIALYGDYANKRNALDCEIVAYIRAKIRNCAWDGTKLAFSKG